MCGRLLVWHLINYGGNTQQLWPVSIKSLTKVFGSSNERFLKSIRSIVDQINAFEPEIEKLSDDQLREKTAFFKAQIQDAVKDARDKDDRKYKEQEILTSFCRKHSPSSAKRASAPQACGTLMCR
jgi:hypothetical protein